MRERRRQQPHIADADFDRWASRTADLFPLRWTAPSEGSACVPLRLLLDRVLAHLLGSRRCKVGLHEWSKPTRGWIVGAVAVLAAAAVSKPLLASSVEGGVPAAIARWDRRAAPSVAGTRGEALESESSPTLQTPARAALPRPVATDTCSASIVATR